VEKVEGGKKKVGGAELFFFLLLFPSFVSGRQAEWREIKFLT